MEEIIIKIDIPVEFKKEFELALDKIVKQFVRMLEFSVTNEILSKSKFTEKDAEELSTKVKSAMHKRLKSEGLI